MNKQSFETDYHTFVSVVL